ncbi:MAG: hypothetical protein LBV53_02480 [Mycoplasmataceae bacterium]|jgi:hypothetical protein|nr:hypothetical protein [Mycoplasmataceae bacterium]
MDELISLIENYIYKKDNQEDDYQDEDSHKIYYHDEADDLDNILKLAKNTAKKYKELEANYEVMTQLVRDLARQLATFHNGGKK